MAGSPRLPRIRAGAARLLLTVALAGLVAGGCVKFVRFDYDLPLQAARRGDAPLERVREEAGPEGARFVAEDDAIRIAWHADMQRLHFRLTNRTGRELRIIWAEAEFERESGLAGPVAHRSRGGGFTVTRARHPTTLPAGGTVEEFVLPASHYELGFVRPLFKLDRASRKSAEAEIPELKGKQLRVTLPLEISGTKVPYTFTFLIRDIRVTE